MGLVVQKMLGRGGFLCKLPSIVGVLDAERERATRFGREVASHPVIRAHARLAEVPRIRLKNRGAESVARNLLCNDVVMHVEEEPWLRR